MSNKYTLPDAGDLQGVQLLPWPGPVQGPAPGGGPGTASLALSQHSLPDSLWYPGIPVYSEQRCWLLEGVNWTDWTGHPV